jgi:outer membrane protein TolC
MRRVSPLLLGLLLASVPLAACRTMRLPAATPPASSAVARSAPAGGFPPPAAPAPPPVAATAPPPAAATAREAGALELAALIREAAASNPRLAAARSRWLASREKGTQARSLPDPMFAYTEMVEPIRTRVGPMDRQVGLTQKIPFPGRLEAAGDVADEQARVKSLEYHIALRDVVADLKVSYVELVYLHRALRIVEENQALARLLAEKAAAAYAGDPGDPSGTLTLFDTLQAQGSLAQLAYDRITLEELLHAEEAKIAALLSRDGRAPLGTPQGLRFRPLGATEQDLIALAQVRRQEIRAAVHKVRAAGHAARLARLARVPDFEVGVQWTGIGASPMSVANSGDDALGLRVGFTLPIWEHKNRARIAEAEHLARAARHEERAARDDVLDRVARLHFRLRNAERLARLYGETLIPQAESAMGIAEQWHDVGRDTWARLLEARSVYLGFRLAHERAVADHEQMVARMEQLVGSSLASLREEAP